MHERHVLDERSFIEIVILARAGLASRVGA
jgi:hypothetical protein